MSNNNNRAPYAADDPVQKKLEDLMNNYVKDESAPSADADALKMAQNIEAHTLVRLIEQRLIVCNDEHYAEADKIAAAALTAHGRAAAKQIKERAAQWHAAQMDKAADAEDHDRAQFHSDSEDAIRALPLDPKQNIARSQPATTSPKPESVAYWSDPKYDTPEMKPSAKSRAMVVMAEMSRGVPCKQTITDALTATYRDGAEAKQNHIIARLRANDMHAAADLIDTPRTKKPNPM